MMKQNYEPPKVEIHNIKIDIITYSEPGFDLGWDIPMHDETDSQGAEG